MTSQHKAEDKYMTKQFYYFLNCTIPLLNESKTKQ